MYSLHVLIGVHLCKNHPTKTDQCVFLQNQISVQLFVFTYHTTKHSSNYKWFDVPGLNSLCLKKKQCNNLSNDCHEFLCVECTNYHQDMIIKTPLHHVKSKGVLFKNGYETTSSSHTYRITTWYLMITDCD